MIRYFDISLNAGAEDISEIEEGFLITTHFESLKKVKKILEAKDFRLNSADHKMIPKIIQKVHKAESEAILNLISELENNDDVNKVYSNLEVE